MLTQTLPSAASEYARAQRYEIGAAVESIEYEWSQMGPEFDLGWERIAGNVEAITRRAQTRLVQGAVDYVPAVLEETAQTAAVATDVGVDAQQLVGLTGAGYLTTYAASFAPVKAKQAVAAGANVVEALATAGEWLSAATGTILSDTGRAAESLGMYSRDVPGYVRMLVPPSCSRCVILAGVFYRMAEAFERHPDCDCRHIPASEAVAGDLTIDPRAYFDSLDEVGQITFAGSVANRQAILDGADINQLVNAYRRSSGLYTAQPAVSRVDGLKYTVSGASDRSWATQQRIGLGMLPPSRTSAVQPRLMPESIYAVARDRDEALQLLRANGWIFDLDARTAGRLALDEQIQRRRKARAATRRRMRREARLDAARATDVPDFNELRETARRMRDRRRNTTPSS